ncbi:hypothetical protein [Agromyces archimandritae]|uniref:Uncharacterized protein n=1 Tax=Agromyces archimandritae TaxID=2781962 RepID=A0A975FR28_9MICO|nr:hypothetical protein [Agromyces archimandritae]QTX05671.1 hypothetical protein G127AT_05555 [Agromyces archimandritae]
MSPEIKLAEALLSRTEALRSHSLRMACWIARNALEKVVDELLEMKDAAAPGANMRTRLVALEVLYRVDDAAIALRAEYAWSRLSNACHFHAFELTPSLAEVRSLVELVADLEATAEKGRTGAAPAA